MLEKLPDGSYGIPCLESSPIDIKPWYKIHKVSPMSDGIPICTVRIETPVVGHPTYIMCGLRSSFYKLEEKLYHKAGQCQELLYWDYTSQFCGVCGTPLKMYTEISKICPHCGKEVWPQLAIAIIVLVSKKDEILLVKANNFRGDFYGLVAGFVETGETLEEAVRREVNEETGLEIKNIQYIASQSWPYPCGLMVGFTAEYECGEIRLQHSELSNGGWFRRENLPNLPEKLSIARMLIDNWLENTILFNNN